MVKALVYHVSREFNKNALFKNQTCRYTRQDQARRVDKHREGNAGIGEQKGRRSFSGRGRFLSSAEKGRSMLRRLFISQFEKDQVGGIIAHMM